VHDIDTKLLEHLLVAAKTLQPGKRVSVDKHHYMLVGKAQLALVKIDGRTSSA